MAENTPQLTTLPAWQAHALAHAAPIAQHEFGPSGVFMGYDFHLGPDGPRLIEINTNAGGAFLNAALARAHRACCESMGSLMDATAPGLPALDATFIKPNSHDWDLAAAELVLNEAGGALRRPDGTRPVYASADTRHGALVAGSGGLLDAMVEAAAAMSTLHV